MCAMSIKVGSRWRSNRGGVELVVVRPPTAAVGLECGGEPMELMESSSPVAPPVSPASVPDVLLGKRYVNETFGIEVLCTKPGAGPLSVAGELMVTKDAKPLPASD